MGFLRVFFSFRHICLLALDFFLYVLIMYMGYMDRTDHYHGYRNRRGGALGSFCLGWDGMGRLVSWYESKHELQALGKRGKGGPGGGHTPPY